MSHSRSTAGGPSSAPSYYEILQLTPTSLDLEQDPAQALKRAYRRALLIHHPDKKQPSLSSTPSITIDQISTAYAVLSSPKQRAEYDRALSESLSPSLPTFQTGIENVDLDDLDYDTETGEWHRSCRCGNPRGYRFGEADLEEAADYGEVMVGCLDCSLWLRVHFAVVDYDCVSDGVQERGGSGKGMTETGG